MAAHAAQNTLAKLARAASREFEVGLGIRIRGKKTRTNLRYLNRGIGAGELRIAKDAENAYALGMIAWAVGYLAARKFQVQSHARRLSPQYRKAAQHRCLYFLIYQHAPAFMRPRIGASGSYSYLPEERIVLADWFEENGELWMAEELRK